MSNQFAAQMRDWTFRSLNTLVKPTGLAIALTRNIPDATFTAQTANELPNTGGYERMPLSPSDVNWSTVAGASGQTFNNVAINFPVATLDWAWASGILIVDNVGYGSGSAIAFGTLSNPRYISATDQYTIPVSGINAAWS